MVNSCVLGCLTSCMLEVCKKTGEMLLTAKAYNGRCITEWLAFELLGASSNQQLHAQDSRIAAASICVFPGSCDSCLIFSYRSKCRFANTLITLWINRVCFETMLNCANWDPWFSKKTSQGFIGAMVWPHWAIPKVFDAGLRPCTQYNETMKPCTLPLMAGILLTSGCFILIYMT